jgi:hypothetical protein
MYPLEAVVICHVNLTFAASSLDAVTEIMALASTHAVDVISGVFPAHVAVRLASTFKPYYPILLPVSVPAVASDGQLRGYVHSHWERVEQY